MNVSGKLLPKLKKKQLTSLQKKLPNFQLGSKGELQAAEYLKKQGFTILDMNVRCGNAEVDIVAIDETANELVFVEVKTRKTSYFGDPSLAVTQKKLLHLIKVARKYRSEKRIWLDYRFDVVAVLPNSIELLKNISWGS